MTEQQNTAESAQPEVQAAQPQQPSFAEQLSAVMTAQQQAAGTAMGERFQDTMDAILSAYARAKIQRLEIMNHNGATLGYVSKMAAANAMGLDDKQRLGVYPFPHSSTEINVGETDSEKRLKAEVESLRDQLGKVTDGQQQAAEAAKKAVEDAAAKARQDAEQAAGESQRRAEEAEQRRREAERQTPMSRNKLLWSLAAATALGLGGGSLTTYLMSGGGGSDRGSVGLEVEGWQTNSPDKETSKKR